MTLVVFAMREEAKDFMQWLGRQSVARRETIGVEILGVGAETVWKKLPVLLQKHRPAWLICAGFAGALTDELKLGEVFLAENRTTVQKRFTHLKTARIVSATTVLDSAEERAECALEHSAQAVDMESEAVAEIAAQKGIPLLTIRAISDTAAAPIPVPFSVAYDLEKQRVRRSAIFFWLFSNPMEWVEFPQFIVRIITTRLALTLALVRTLEQLLAEKPDAPLN